MEQFDRIIGRAIRALRQRGAKVLAVSLFAAALLAAAAQRGSPAKRETPESKSEPAEPVHQVVLLALGPKWIKGTALEEQPEGKNPTHELFESHVRYVKGLFEAGTLLIAGPFLDDSGEISFSAISGGMYVIAAETAERARSIAEGDPFVQAGMFQVVEVRRWRIALSRYK